MSYDVYSLFSVNTVSVKLKVSSCQLFLHRSDFLHALNNLRTACERLIGVIHVPKMEFDTYQKPEVFLAQNHLSAHSKNALLLLWLWPGRICVAVWVKNV